MKNFFENKMNKGNPFINKDDKKGDEINTMAEEEIKETEQENIIEEPETILNTEEKEEENTDSETEKMKQDLENLNNQYLRLAADFENYRKSTRKKGLFSVPSGKMLGKLGISGSAGDILPAEARGGTR